MRTHFFIIQKGIDEMIFKIVPDYNSRITQLKKGEVDFVELVKTEDIPELKKVDFLNITSQKGREYDYVAWNNIDYQLYNKTQKVEPNKFFGSSVSQKSIDLRNKQERNS